MVIHLEQTHLLYRTQRSHEEVVSHHLRKIIST